VYPNRATRAGGQRWQPASISVPMDPQRHLKSAAAILLTHVNPPDDHPVCCLLAPERCPRRSRCQPALDFAQAHLHSVSSTGLTPSSDLEHRSNTAIEIILGGRSIAVTLPSNFLALCSIRSRFISFSFQLTTRLRELT
jgi:hypothetical protein